MVRAALAALTLIAATASPAAAEERDARWSGAPVVSDAQSPPTGWVAEIYRDEEGRIVAADIEGLEAPADAPEAARAPAPVSAPARAGAPRAHSAAEARGAHGQIRL